MDDRIRTCDGHVREWLISRRATIFLPASQALLLVASWPWHTTRYGELCISRSETGARIVFRKTVQGRFCSGRQDRRTNHPASGFSRGDPWVRSPRRICYSKAQRAQPLHHALHRRGTISQGSRTRAPDWARQRAEPAALSQAAFNILNGSLVRRSFEAPDHLAIFETKSMSRARILRHTTQQQLSLQRNSGGPTRSQA